MKAMKDVDVPLFYVIPVQIKLMDKDFMKSDDDLGYAILPLAGLRGGGEVDLSLRVEG
jgi:hypothetical protein